MYVSPNFPTKKALKEAVDRYNHYQQLSDCGPMTIGAVLKVKEPRPKEVTIWQPNADLTGAVVPTDGEVSVEGPHFVAHSWYARVTLKDGCVVKVR